MTDSFIYQNHKIVIKSGEDFSRSELISRLHQMNIDFNPNEKSKKYYINMYNESIKNNNNKLKIIEKLIGDTKEINYSMNEKNKTKNEITHQNFQNNTKVNNIEIFNPVKKNYIYDKFKVNNDNVTKNNYEIPSSLINDSEYIDYNNNTNFPNKIYMAGNNKNEKNNNDNINIDPNSFPIQNESVYKDEFPLKSQINKSVNPDYIIKNNQKKTYTNFDTPFGPESNTFTNNNNANIHNEYNPFSNKNYNPIYKNEKDFQQNSKSFQNINNINTNKLNEKNYDIPFKTPMNYNPDIFLNNNQNSFQNINKQPIINQNNLNMNLNKNLNNPIYQNIKNENNNQTVSNINKNINELNMPNKFLQPKSSNNQNKEFNYKPISYPNLDNNTFQQNMNNYNKNMHTKKNETNNQNQNYTNLNYYNKNDLNTTQNQSYSNNNNMYNNIANKNNKNNNYNNMFHNNNISSNNNNNKYNNTNNMYNPQNYKFNKNPQNEDNDVNTPHNFQQDIPIRNTNVSLSHTNFNNNNNYNPNIPYNNNYYIYNNVPTNNPDNNKESSNLGYTLLAMFLAMIVLCFGIWVIMKYSRIAINEVAVTLSPRNIFFNVILKLILKFIKKLCWDYLFYTLPFVVINFGIRYLVKRYKKWKLIKEIFDDIKSRLIEIYNTNINNGVIGITEAEIINSYSIRYNITFNDFNRNYMPQLRELRKKNDNIKEKEEIINGYKQIYWYWNE